MAEPDGRASPGKGDVPNEAIVVSEGNAVVRVYFADWWEDCRCGRLSLTTMANRITNLVEIELGLNNDPEIWWDVSMDNLLGFDPEQEKWVFNWEKNRKEYGDYIMNLADGRDDEWTLQKGILADALDDIRRLGKPYTVPAATGYRRFPTDSDPIFWWVKGKYMDEGRSLDFKTKAQMCLQLLQYHNAELMAVRSEIVDFQADHRPVELTVVCELGWDGNINNVEKGLESLGFDVNDWFYIGTRIKDNQYYVRGLLPDAYAVIGAFEKRATPAG